MIDLEELLNPKAPPLKKGMFRLTKQRGVEVYDGKNWVEPPAMDFKLAGRIEAGKDD